MTVIRGGLPVITTEEAMRYLATPWTYALVAGPRGVAVVDLDADGRDACYVASLSDETEAEWLIEGWIEVGEVYDPAKPAPVNATQLALDEAARRYPELAG